MLKKLNLRDRMRQIDWWQVGLDYLLISVGSLLMALSFDMFFIPNDIVAGGISGIGIITHDLLGWPVGVVTIALNIPLFLAALRWGGGPTTGIRTVYAVLLSSILIDVLAPYVPPVTETPLLYVTYGGAVGGIGLGLILRAQGTTGGTDIIGRLLRHFTGLPISQGIFISDLMVMIGAVAAFGLERALYGVLVIAISAWTVDLVLAGGRQSRQAIIISEKWEAIQNTVLKELERGMTVMPAKGAYTGIERPILMCIIGRSELVRLRRVVMAIDPDAFVIISKTSEVWGEGFGAIDSDL